MDNTTTTYNVRRGRRIYTFENGRLWDATDPSNPLAGSLRGPLNESVVLSDGRRHMVALRDEVEIAR